MSVVRDQTAGVNARAAGDVEQVPVTAQIQGFRDGLAEIHSPAIHRRGELIGECFVLHRSGPFLFVFEAAPVRRSACAQHVEKVLAHGALLQRRVVRSDKPGRTFDKMFPCQISQLKDSTFTLQKPHRGEEREHHIGRSLPEFEGVANPGLVGWMLVEPGEEIEPHERGGQQVGGEEAVAVAVD